VAAEANLDQAVLDLVEGRVGTVFKNKWHVDALIGTGGMAAVYSGTHRNGNRVALKVLHLQLSMDQSLSRRFKQEGYAANAVQHPGVVRVLDDDMTDDGCAFLVMELLEGETTSDRADRLGGRLPLQDVMHIIDGVLDILATAHEAGIVHRDVKPENIFLTKNREVKLLDFGIARLRRGTAASAGATAAAMGTPAFMPPEQALGHMDKVDALSDVWATGATMYTLLSGRLVHHLETANEVLVAAATRQAQSLFMCAPELPNEIIDVVDRSLAYDKKNRWSSAKAMQYALRNAAIDLSSPWHSKVQVAAALVSGSHRVVGDEIGERDTLAPAPEHPNEIVSTGAGVGIDVPRRARRRKTLVAMTSAVAATAVVGAVLGGVALTRKGGDPPVKNAGNPPAQVVTAPPPAASVQTTAVTENGETEAESQDGTALEFASDDADASASPNGHKRRFKPVPKEPPREKSWLDRRR